jgi:hypothetical protein
MTISTRFWEDFWNPIKQQKCFAPSYVSGVVHACPEKRRIKSKTIFKDTYFVWKSIGFRPDRIVHFLLHRRWVAAAGESRTQSNTVSTNQKSRQNQITSPSEVLMQSGAKSKLEILRQIKKNLWSSFRKSMKKKNIFEVASIFPTLFSTALN